jgi:hypothetical protein
MKKTVILLLLMFLSISCHRDKIDKIPINTSQTIPIDTTKYDEVRYVTAKHFTSSGLYNLHCKMCHGNNGTGDGIVARYHKDEYCPYDLSKNKKSEQQVYYIILNGTEHMPDAEKPVSKHILTNDDIWMVVVYIKNFKNEKN